MYSKIFIIIFAFAAVRGGDDPAENQKLFASKKATFVELHWPDEFDFRRLEGSVTWDTFSFMMYSIRDENLNCLYHGVSVAIPTEEKDHFSHCTKFRMGCQFKVDNLKEVLRKEADDKLVYKLDGGKCCKATYKYTKEKGCSEVGCSSSDEYPCASLPGDEKSKNAHVRPAAEDELE